jgi:protein-disulfide isomerase
MEQENKEKELEGSKNQEKKIKNLISLVILLGGLFLGSIFVDVAQMVRGGGFSAKKLAQTDIFNFGNKTWVAYNEPIVKMQVLSDDTCETCKPDEVVLGIHRIVPTVLTEKVDINSEKGASLIKKFEVKTIPAFIISPEIEKTEFFKQAEAVFNKKDDAYVLKTSDLGIQPGKYIESPQVEEGDIQIGDKESKVKLFLFSDFQCPYCKTFHEGTLKKILSVYGDKISFVFKNYPLSFHPQAENAALAVECANEQGKFAAYADKVFANQATWGKTEGTASFKTYAQQIGLNVAQFNQCLDDKKYSDKINGDKDDANNFGISGTPTLFINDQVVNTASAYDNLKKIIDDELAK